MTDQLLSEFINLPDEAQRSGFVISLTDSIGRAQQTLDNYVVTPDLQSAFREALTLVTTAVSSNASRGTYIQSSFGGGKSHFMSVLTLTLEGEPATRAKEGLAEVIAEYDAKLAGRKFLVVPMNMIGAKSVESAVFGGYVKTVRAKHRDASLPAVYLADGLLDNARDLRETMGDDAFFSMLGTGGSAVGWGKLAGGWDVARFEAAAMGAPGSPERDELVSALVSGPLKAVPGAAAATGEGLVGIDEGTGVISRHAKSLGYDAVVFMLDELILWLASQMADQAFVSREGPKVAKLVESGTSERPAPIVAILARQKDLNDLVDEQMPHADQLRFGNVLAWWEGRFDNINLAEGNLRAIVEKRLLAPRSLLAQEAIDQAFKVTTGNAGERVIDTLCTSTGDRAEFRQVYPFSPALISALVDLSSVLQRERTALRVLAQLLHDRRDTLKLGDLVPLGDLYDVIADGDEPFSQQIKEYWDTAKRLYRTKFRPFLLADHSLTEAEAEQVPETHPFHSDDRLVKTLLLAAIVPGSVTLGNLTASRLAALNHGTIKSPIKGEERAVVANKLRKLSAEIGELKVEADTADPTAIIRLLDVDTESVLHKADGYDTSSARRTALREMLFESIGVVVGNSMFPSKTIIWKGTRREIDVVFGNLADANDITDMALQSATNVKIVLDFPFDPEGTRSARDDVARAGNYVADNPATRTMCWIPQFFSARSMTDLGNYVVHQHVLTGDNFDRYASHLSAQDRPVAKQLLASRRDGLRDRLRIALRQAYRVDEPTDAMVVPALEAEEQFVSLNPTFKPVRPVAVDLRDAFEKLAGQHLAHLYPGHPEFDEEIKTADLRAVLGEIIRAATMRVARLDVPAGPLRKQLRRIANPLKLGTMHEAHYTPETAWSEHVVRKLADEAPPVLTVGLLRRWTDEPVVRGLPREVQDLVILAIATETDRVLMRGGAVVAGDIGRLDDDIELHSQTPPPEADWKGAVERAGAIFGLVASPIATAAAVVKLVNELRAKAAEFRNSTVDLHAELKVLVQRLGLPADADRLRTAAAARDLLDKIATTADDASLLHLLAGFEIPTTEAGLGKSITSAQSVTGAIKRTNWQLLENASKLSGAFAAEAGVLTTKVSGAVSDDEFVTALQPALVAAEAQATELLGRAVVVPPPTPPSPPPPPSPTDGHTVVRESRTLEALTPDEAKARLEELETALAAERGDVVVDLKWTIRGPADSE